MIKPRPRLLMLINEDWYFWSHRLHLARAAREAGYEVSIATRVGSHGDRIRAEGFSLLPVEIPRSIENPFTEFRALRELVRTYREWRPDLVHHVTLKSVLLGTAAARLAGVPAIINAYAGLGHLFTARGWRAAATCHMVKNALRWTIPQSRAWTIVQNRNDLDDLLQAGVADESRTRLIRGAGVDLEQFRPQSRRWHPPTVLLASRMLWSKGVADFVEAARILRARGCVARFALAGRVDSASPDHVPVSELRRWELESGVEWLNHRDDMPALLSRSSIVCLPTYYGEGLPKVLLEAAACGKPMIASDIRGCRDICRGDVTGLLVPPRDPRRLAAAVEELLGDAELRLRLGSAARELAEQEFGVERIAQQTLDLYREISPPTPSHRLVEEYAA